MNQKLRPSRDSGIDAPKNRADEGGREDDAREMIRGLEADREVVAGFKYSELQTSALVSRVHSEHAKIDGLVKKGYSRADAGSIRDGMQMIDHADKVNMFLHRESSPVNLHLLRYAALKGKVGAIAFDDRTVPLAEIMRVTGTHPPLGGWSAETAPPLPREKRDWRMDSGAAGMIFARIHKETGKPSRRECANLRDMFGERNIGDFLRAVSNIQFAWEVAQTGIVSESSMEALARAGADWESLRDTADDLLAELERGGKAEPVTVAGYDQFPQSLRDAGEPPFFAYVRGEPARNGQGFLGSGQKLAVFGSPENNPRANEYLRKFDGLLRNEGVEMILMEREHPDAIQFKPGDMFIGGNRTFHSENSHGSPMDLPVGASLILFDRISHRNSRGDAVEDQFVINCSTPELDAAHASVLAERLLVTGRTSASAAPQIAVCEQIRMERWSMALDPDDIRAPFSDNPEMKFLDDIVSTDPDRRGRALAPASENFKKDVDIAIMIGPIATRIAGDMNKAAKTLAEVLRTGEIPERKRAVAADRDAELPDPVSDRDLHHVSACDTRFDAGSAAAHQIQR